MRETRISLPELGLIAVTRAALGVGVGLLLSEQIGGRTRRGVGWALVVFGALITVPLVAEVLGKGRSVEGGGTSTNGHTGVKEKSTSGASAANMQS